jgi:hypothetical protein
MALIVGTNSYIDVDEAQAYFDNRLYSDAWTNASQEDKSKALITASSRIDNVPVMGIKKIYSQPLEFPRYFETDVSQNVKNAVCEEALALLKGVSKRIELQRQGVKSFSFNGGMSENYGNGKNSILYSHEAMEFMKPYFGSVRME